MDEATEVNAGGIKEDATRLGEVLERQDAHGGETMMAGIFFNRSYRWIRELARLYKATYGKDLAKAVRRHFRNLVVCSLKAHSLRRKRGKPLYTSREILQTPNTFFPPHFQPSPPPTSLRPHTHPPSTSSPPPLAYSPHKRAHTRHPQWPNTSANAQSTTSAPPSNPNTQSPTSPLPL